MFNFFLNIHFLNLRCLNQAFVAFLIFLGVHKGAFFQLLVSFNKNDTPSIKEVFGFHLMAFFILLILAKDLNGSPGLIGIFTLLLLINFAKSLTLCSLPLAKLKIEFDFLLFATQFIIIRKCTIIYRRLRAS